MKRLTLSFACAALAAAATAPFAPPAAALNLGTQPLYLGASIPPVVMLLTPKDHQLFKKAYDDFSDLDGSLVGGDTALEITYKHSIDYYGYFDPFKCYTYSNANGRFEPSTSTATKYCTAGTAWSGNFLNWVTMSRIDVMRRLLFGGYRSTDTNGTTVLERALIPTEAHAWAKHYRGSDIAQLVPFTSLNTTDATLSSTTSNVIGAQTAVSISDLDRAAGSSGTVTATATTAAAHGFIVGQTVLIAGVTGGSSGNVNGNRVVTGVPNSTTFTFDVVATAANSPQTSNMPGTKTATAVSLPFVVTLPAGERPYIIGDQVTVERNSSNFMIGEITAVSGGSGTITFLFLPTHLTGSGSHNSWTVTNWSRAGISVCNTTQATSGTSHASTAAPLMRVAWGDYSLWGVGDGTACRWTDEGGGPNGNRIGDTEMKANSRVPPRGTSINANLNDASGVTNGDYNVRVLACDAAFIGTERCTQYPNGNLKPTGLLQDYAAGQNKKIKFGLFTGTYVKNKSGGVLRKNPDFLDSSTSASPSFFNAATDELNADTGVFNSAVAGIIQSFNSIKLFGYTFASGTGSYSAADGCGLLSPDPTEGNCTSWGNPLSEMFVETLRYLGGRTPTAAFTYTEAAGQKDYDLGLRQPAWASPLTASTYCTPLNIIMMNASVNSYDNDQVPSDLFPAGQTAITLTNTVGSATNENIVGNFLIGNNGSVNNGVCSSKAVGGAGTGLGDLFGICPEAPALRGSYQMVGAAHWAHTNRIRSDLTPPASDAKSLKVTTYGIALASAVPTIQIPVPGSSPVRFVTLQPTARTYNGATDRGHGSIVDFKVIRQDHAAGTGKFFVSWEDSTQGNDYDLDMWGFISYRFISSNTQIEVTTDVVYAAAGHSIAFGYVISGTAAEDGAHFLSAHKGNQVISYQFPTGFNTTTTGNNECNDCSQANAPALKVYNVSAAGAASVLKEPLWYSAKYGGFNDQNANSRPDLATEWDSKNNITGADGTDGNPDTYFPVTNPGALESALDRAFISVLQVSSASSVATNSTSLQSGSVVYQARFNANEWSGQLLAFSISTTGLIDPTPLWDAGQLIPAANSRTIITYRPNPANQALGDSPKGVPFRFDSLNSLQQADLNKNAVGTADAAGTDCTGVTTTGFTPAGCTKQGRLRLNWLRGDPANEGATATKYRVRPTTRLGDIVNSTPIYVGPPTTAQYGDFGPPAAAYTSDATYETYRNTAGIVDRRAIIYAAGNDGMLHGFDASTDPTKGVEKLAFVPSTTYRNLTRLTDKTYSHRYYVDGSPTVADVKFDDGSWHTILVGGLNAGGQGIYALDITQPNDFSEGNANSIVLWEWTDYNDNRLGHTYSQPSIAKMRNGKFAVIFGNGYNNSIAAPPADTGALVSASGCASLHILFVEGGIDGSWGASDFVTIDVPVDCSAANPNGLATPRVLDVDNDGFADYVYSGDLRGNMWKFDVRSASPAAWALSNGATPFFVAADPSSARQPITSPATTFPNPAQAGTTMVLFGTGKYLEQIDNAGPYQYQSFYGLWDRHDGSTISGRSELLQQKVLGASVSNPLGVTADDVATTTIDESGFRISTPYRPNYTAVLRANTQFGETNPLALDETASTAAGQRGWYMDFPFSGDPSVGTGERVVFRPLISTGKLVFTTLVPSSANCEFGGTSFLMDLDPVTGARLGVSPLDVNNDNNFNSADLISTPWGTVAVSGMQSRIGILPPPTVIRMPPNEIKVLSGSSGALITVKEKGEDPPLPGAAGRRILWRQLFTD